MSWELGLEYLKTLIWPVVVVFGAIMLRGRIGDLLDRIVELVLPGGVSIKAQAREKAENAQELSREAVAEVRESARELASQVETGGSVAVSGDLAITGPHRAPKPSETVDNSGDDLPSEEASRDQDSEGVAGDIKWLEKMYDTGFAERQLQDLMTDAIREPSEVTRLAWDILGDRLSLVMRGTSIGHLSATYRKALVDAGVHSGLLTTQWRSAHHELGRLRHSPAARDPEVAIRVAVTASNLVRALNLDSLFQWARWHNVAPADLPKALIEAHRLKVNSKPVPREQSE